MPPPSGVTGNVLPWVVWTIWTARNQLIFEERSSSPREIATKSIASTRELTQAQRKPDNSQNHSLSRSHDQRHKQRNPIVCKTDASWNQSSKKVGTAWIFMGLPSSMICQASLIEDFVSSPLMAEAMAVRSALQMAATLDLTDLNVCSDNQTLVRAITNKQPIKEIYRILSDITRLCPWFASISFKFIPRSENGEADELAKTTLRLSVSVTRPLNRLKFKV